MTIRRHALQYRATMAFLQKLGALTTAQHALSSNLSVVISFLQTPWLIQCPTCSRALTLQRAKSCSSDGATTTSFCSRTFCGADRAYNLFCMSCPAGACALSEELALCLEPGLGAVLCSLTVHLILAVFSRLVSCECWFNTKAWRRNSHLSALI